MLYLLLACSNGKDSLDSESPGPTWQAIGEELPSALLSINGNSASDVWTVGADVGSGPAVYHYDGASWSKLETGTTGNLWWARPIGNVTFLVGEGGQVIKVENGQITSTDVLDETVTWFGCWGSSPTDVWVVGGRPDQCSDGCEVYHYDGTSWTRAEIPAEARAALAVFKVWGSSASDVWAVGSGGIAIHFDGTTWTSSPTNMTRNLFTAAGAEGVVYAVGGSSTASVLRYTDGAWTDETPAMSLQLNGVFATSATDAIAVGNSGGVWLRNSSGWTEDTRKDPIYNDFHAVWVDDLGGSWAVGGHLASEPLIQGMMYYIGDTTPTSL